MSEQKNPALYGGFMQGICGCCGDCGTCCLGYWCPCILFGETYDKVFGGGCCVPCFVYTCLFCVPCCCWGPKMRKAIRERFQIREEPCSDCCVYFWCMGLATCQEAAEIKKRGVENFHTPAPTAAAPQQQSM